MYLEYSIVFMNLLIALLLVLDSPGPYIWSEFFSRLGLVSF